MRGRHSLIIRGPTKGAQLFVSLSFLVWMTLQKNVYLWIMKNCGCIQSCSQASLGEILPIWCFASSQKSHCDSCKKHREVYSYSKPFIYELFVLLFSFCVRGGITHLMSLWKRKKANAWIRECDIDNKSAPLTTPPAVTNWGCAHLQPLAEKSFTTWPSNIFWLEGCQFVGQITLIKLSLPQRIFCIATGTGK